MLIVALSIEDTLFFVTMVMYIVLLPGMTHLAVHYYQKALDVPPVLPNDERFDLRHQIAFNFSLIYRQSGNLEMARELLSTYCVIWTVRSGACWWRCEDDHMICHVMQEWYQVIACCLSKWQQHGNTAHELLFSTCWYIIAERNNGHMICHMIQESWYQVTILCL